MSHSIAPVEEHDRTRRARVGTAQCARPYDVALLNISAMSFGSLSARAIEALNLGAKTGGFYHDTGEGGFSPYHRAHGGDIVWERSEEHTSELQSLMRISYAVFCLKKKKNQN